MRRLLLLLGWLVGAAAIASAGDGVVYRPRFSSPPAVTVPGPQPVNPPQRYLILQPSQAGVGQAVRPSPYAYGWFGAAPRQHIESSRGYYGTPAIWKAR